MNDAAPSPAPPASSSKLKTFLRRLLSTVILWTVVIGAMFSGDSVLSNAVFLLIMCTLTVVGLLEFYGLAKRIGLFCFKYPGILGGLLLVIGTFLHLTGKLGISGTPARVNDFEISFIILFVLGLCVRQFLSKSNTAGIVAISVTLFGLMYVPWLLNFIQKIYYFPGVNGVYYVLYFIIVTKFSDTGAYITGSLIGKTKMIPRISPGKTWEGFAGAILFSVGASVAFAHLARSKVPEFTLPHAVILGMVLATAAVVGDLIESLFKREAGVKDSGGFFPGIGGILDLLDSLLFNAPLMYLYLRHVITNPALNA
jgi:phosphatidate cytidylyltransferase